MSAAPDKPATLLDAFNHYRLPQPLRQSLLDLVGAESEDDDPEILAHIPTETLEESVRGILIDGAPPTPMNSKSIYTLLAAAVSSQNSVYDVLNKARGMANPIATK